MGIFERADYLGLTLIPSVFCYRVKAMDDIIYFNPSLGNIKIDEEVHKIMDQYEEFLRDSK